jgi:hypothetical protein
MLSQQLFSFYTKYFMKSKMGRPKVAKAKLRGIIVNARFSPEEHKKIIEAVERSQDTKSDWIRKTLLEKAA